MTPAPAMLVTTTDSVPQQYRVLGLVRVGFAGDSHPTRTLAYQFKPGPTLDAHFDRTMQQLIAQAAAMGANAILGLRVDQMWGLNNVLLGTAAVVQLPSA